MRTEVTTVAETDRIVFGYWDADRAEFVVLRESHSEEEIAEFAKKFGCTPLLVDALISLTDVIAEAVGKDLKDIWMKLS